MNTSKATVILATCLLCAFEPNAVTKSSWVNQFGGFKRMCNVLQEEAPSRANPQRLVNVAAG